MKKCAYCGRENDDAATHCRECGTGEFLAPGPAPTQPRVEAGKDEPEAITPAEDSIPELSIPGESAVCPTCHTLNVPDVTFCQRCGAPIGFISTIGPLETAYAEGFAYRRAVEGRPQFIVVVGIWLIFFPSSSQASVSVFQSSKYESMGLAGSLGFSVFSCSGFALASA